MRYNNFEFSDTPPIQTTTEKWFNNESFAINVFNNKYALERDGRKETISEMIWRVATYIASAELTQEKATEKANLWFNMMYRKDFWPGGRICYAAGNPKKTSLINCTSFDLGRDRNGDSLEPDSLEAIYEMAYLVGKVESRGEGVGVDISKLRFRGASADNAAITSTGAVSWMDIYSWTTGTIAQEGRRGACLICLDDSHPDIEEFIDIKSYNLPALQEARKTKASETIIRAIEDSLKIKYANISIKISDDLMKSYLVDGLWDLKWKGETVRTIKAKDLVSKLAEKAWLSAEPGCLYWDTSKRYSNSDAVGYPVVAVNACSEQVLSFGSSCTLCNINLSTLPLDLSEAVKETRFRAREVFNFLYNTTVCQLRDDRCPTKVQHDDLSTLHRVGVGYTALGDFLLQQGLQYDDDEAADLAESITQALCIGAYEENLRLGKERGVYKAFDWEKLKNSEFIQRLLLSGIFTEEQLSQGMASVCALTLPPTGTVSLMLQTSSGVEPAFAPIYYRRTRLISEGYPHEYEWSLIVHPPVRKMIKEKEGIDVEELEDKEKFELVYKYFPPKKIKCADDIDMIKKIEMMGRIQKWIDSSISVTFNGTHKTTTPKTIEDVYVKAWEVGLKGCSVYIEHDSNREPILTTKKPKSYNFSFNFLEKYGNPYHFKNK